MQNPVNGNIITLQAGDYRAEVTSVGASLASLTKSGRNLVLPFPVDQMPAAYKGKILAPWPNRIARGRYTYAGVEQQLPVNEVHTGTAAHGFVAYSNWEVTAQSESAVSLAFFLPPQRGYPYAIRFEAVYNLNPDAGLVARVVAQNIGTDTAPYGIAVHPYLTCDGAPLDRCLLGLPASSVMEVDQNLLPTREVLVEGTNFDFRTARVVGTTQIDNAFSQLPPEEWNADLTDPVSGMTVRLTSNEKWVQIYSADQLDRPGVAVEPMTCPPDAFNSGTDVIHLAPGDLTELTYSIREI